MLSHTVEQRGIRKLIIITLDDEVIGSLIINEDDFKEIDNGLKLAEEYCNKDREGKDTRNLHEIN